MPEYQNFTDLDLSKRYTYADYLLFKFKERVEILKGYIYTMSPAPSRNHQEIAGNLFEVFKRFFYQQKCKVYFAPFDVRLITSSKDDKEITTVFQPDLCVICDLDKLDDKGCLGSPDLIVEILSPGNTEKEMKIKYNIYEESGVLEYWIVQPEYENVLQFVLKNGKYELNQNGLDTIKSVIFPDLKLDLSQIFAK